VHSILFVVFLKHILHEIRKRKANWIGHILRRNCLLKQGIEGKIQGKIEVTRRRGRRRKKLLDDLGDRRGYSHLKDEALDRIKWRNRFGRGSGPVVWQITDDDSSSTVPVLIKCEYNSAAHQQLTDFMKDSDLVTREVMHNTRWFKYDRDDLCVNKSQFVPVIFEPPCIFTKFGVVVMLTEMHFSDAYSKIWACKQFPIQNGLKLGDTLSPLLYNVSLEYTIRKVQINQEGQKLNETHQLRHVSLSSPSSYASQLKTVWSWLA
jgi:hypothetical protein